MPFQRGLSPHPPVALLAEGVDRNSFNIPQIPQLATVALLAEGVDRNCAIQNHCGRAMEVALLPVGAFVVDDRSPSSRRAWIEMFMETKAQPFFRSRPPRGGRG